MSLKSILQSVTPRNRWQAAVIGAVVAGSLSAGVSYASIPDGDGVITGCYKPSNAVTPLKLIDTARRSQCPNGYDSLTWNQTGPQGLAGPQGVQGPQGDIGPAGAEAPSYATQASPTGTTPATLTLPMGTYIVQEWGVGNDDCGNPSATDGSILETFDYNYGEITALAQITGTAGQLQWSCSDGNVSGTFLAEAREVTTQ